MASNEGFKFAGKEDDGATGLCYYNGLEIEAIFYVTNLKENEKGGSQVYSITD